MHQFGGRIRLHSHYSRVFVVVVATLWCGSHGATAADLRNVLAGYNLRSWSKKDGLPSNGVSAVAQDAEGYIWFGTDQGVVRFDGVRFTSWAAVGSTTALPNAPGPGVARGS